jgi:hypothetical protein
VPDILVIELNALKAKRDLNVPFVFHKQGVHLNRKTIAGAYNRALQHIGISHLSSTHLLRKTAATLANEATGDFYAVSALVYSARDKEHNNAVVLKEIIDHT